MNKAVEKIRLYWPLIKSLQTGLLVFTGMAGFMTARCPINNVLPLTGLLISLFASISGSTILNMWWDRDIDAKMMRTRKRPLASNKIDAQEAFWIGLFLSVFGVGFAFLMDVYFGVIIFAGLFFDVVIYTIWLKRRTCWSIVWGGISGAMPILAGRVLGLGSFDWIGIVLSLGILFWIPTHILTFSMRYFDDYKIADIPTFVSSYGVAVTRGVIAYSSVIAVIAMGFAAWGIGMSWGFLSILAILSVGLVSFAGIMLFRPSGRLDFGLFKFASVYMLFSMVLMAFV
ncbi:MAG: UbiA family prenyltransferase [Anaerolineaceae bacterium]|nr:UbiA family prenyltransferase [Anaerolineaceae bacterium]